MTNRHRLIVFLIGSSFLFVLWIFVIGLRDVSRGKRSHSWPRTTGVVTKSEVASRRTTTETRVVGAEKRSPSERTARTDSTVFYPVIEYRYDVTGKTWTSRRITLSDGIDSQDVKVAESVVNRYPLGASVTVHYCPGDEALAVLEPGVSDGAVAQSVIGGALSLMIGGVLAFLLSRRGRQVVQDCDNPPQRRRDRRRGRR